MKNFKEHLAEADDYDLAMCSMAQVLGIVPDDKPDDPCGVFREHKGLWCSRTPLGDAMYRVALVLEHAGIIEFDNGGYKWNEDYDFNTSYENGVIPVFESCTCDKSISKNSE